MTPTNFLPKLKDGTQDRLTTAKAPGAWNDEQGQSRLAILADAIEDPSKNVEVRSIPDPWARAILFARALFQRDHKLHLQTRGEWRGLLAILGLKDIRGYTELSAQPVSLKDKENGTGFLATLARIRFPVASAFAEGGTWEQFHLLRWSGSASGDSASVFGLTSPATLVMTGASYVNVFNPEDVPWFSDGRLTDPSASDTDLSMQERRWLAEWVLAVRLQLRDIKHGRRLGDLLDHLQEFADDLHAGAEVPKSDDLFSDYGLGLTTPEFYKGIDKPRRRKAPTLTELRIVTDTPQAESKVYLLYDPTLSTQLSRKEREIYFYETHTLASAPRNYPVTEAKSGQLPRTASSEVHWCNKAFFFQDDLIYDQVEASPGDLSGGADSFPGCRPVRTTGASENRHIVLPLTEDAARLFTPKYLEENFSIEWLHGGGARCRLKLRLASLVNPKPGASLDLKVSPDDATFPVVIEHVYGERDMNKITGEVMPLICVWPNFQCADEPTNSKLTPLDLGFRNRWKRYYLFEAWPGVKEAKELEVTPLDLPAADRREIRQQNGILQVVTITQRFPEVLVCKMPFSGKKQRRNDNDPPKGLMLLRKPPEMVPVSHGTDAILGIDFGTTGTSIYWARQSGDNVGNPEEMSFASRIFQVTTRAQHEVKDLTRHHFIPSASNPSGRMLSVFQVKGTEGGTSELLDGHVLFQSVDESPQAAAPFVWGEPSTIVINLKWGSNPRESDAAAAFLKQLCLQSLAELVCNLAESVEIRYSYPTAFDDKDLERFQGIWKATLDELRTATSLNLTLGAHNESNYEAVAATRFFKAKGGLTISGGAVTLDIGGGTTDIAFWSLVDDEPALADHSSVLFAGTDMFQSVLRKNLGVLKEIDKDFPMPSLDQSKYPLAYFAELDALIATRANAVLSRLPFVVEASGSVEQFIHILEIGMCGIAFYTGLLLGNQVAKKRYNLDDVRTVQVFVGGNASRLLHWCDLGEFKAGSFFYNVFCDLIRVGTEVGAPDALKDKGIQVNVSRAPKHEVAYGLVAKSHRVARKSDYAQPAGEAFVGAEGPHAWQDTPDVKSIAESRLRVDRKLPVFTQFLDAIHEELSPADRDAVVNAVNETLGNMAAGLLSQSNAPRMGMMRNRNDGEKSNPIRNQPLFILLLKQLIDLRIGSLGKA